MSCSMACLPLSGGRSFRRSCRQGMRQDAGSLQLCSQRPGTHPGGRQQPVRRHLGNQYALQEVSFVRRALSKVEEHSQAASGVTG